MTFLCETNISWKISLFKSSLKKFKKKHFPKSIKPLKWLKEKKFLPILFENAKKCDPPREGLFKRPLILKRAITEWDSNHLNCFNRSSMTFLCRVLSRSSIEEKEPSFLSCWCHQAMTLQPFVSFFLPFLLVLVRSITLSFIFLTRIPVSSFHAFLLQQLFSVCCYCYSRAYSRCPMSVDSSTYKSSDYLLGFIQEDKTLPIFPSFHKICISRCLPYNNAFVSSIII